MKVKVFGIQFNTGKAVTVSQFFDHLIASNTTNIDFHGFKRFLYLKKHDEKYIGLFVTTKDHKKFMEMSAREIWRGLMMKKMEMICFKVVVGKNCFIGIKTSVFLIIVVVVIVAVCKLILRYC